MHPAAASHPLSAFDALIYGLIQGVTEFLPVSSSGHLAIAHRLGLGHLPPELELPFDVLLHGGTLIAIFIAFRREIMASLAWRPKLYLAFLVSIVPAGIAGLLFKDVVESMGKSWWALTGLYAYTAVLLIVAERLSLRFGKGKQAVPDSATPSEQLETVTVRQAAWVGGLQVFALLPGVSRSGSTIAGGLISGMSPALAVSYSFLVGLPLIAGATAKDALDGGLAKLVHSAGWMPLSIGFLTALVSGIASIAVLKLVVGKRRLVWFGVYCGLVSLACLVVALRGGA